jgi:hypothetical protein
MLHLNATGANAPDSDYMLGVVIHEFVHLINYRYDPNDEGWLNESLAEAAMTLGGYKTDLPIGQQYVKQTANTPLCVTGYSNYGATFSWGSYMLDRFGPTFLAQVLQDPAHGPPSIEAHLPAGSTFQSAFGEFMVANLIDQHGIGDGRYGYMRIQESGLGVELAGVIDGASHTSDSVVWGARTLRFTPTGAGTLTLTIASPDFAKLVVHTIAFNPAQPQAATVTAQPIASASAALTVPVAASQVVDVVVAVDPGASIPDLTGAARTSFSYTATFGP